MPNGVSLEYVNFLSQQNGTTVYLGDTLLVSFGGYVDGTSSFFETPEGPIEIPSFELVTYDAGFNIWQYVDEPLTPLNDVIYMQSASGDAFTFSPLTGEVSLDTAEWSAGTYSAYASLDVYFSDDSQFASNQGSFSIYDAVDLDFFAGEVSVDELGFATAFSLHDALFGGSGDFSDYGFNVLLSQDDVFDSDDTVLTSFTVADADSQELASYSFNISAQMPADIAPGDYHIGLIFDPTDAYFETEENKTASFTSFTVEDPLNTDLTSQLFTARRIGDDLFEVVYTVLDSGDTELESGVSVDFYLEYTLDEAPVSINVLSTSIEAGQIGFDTVELFSIFPDVAASLPENFTLRMAVDEDESIAETDETNNDDTVSDISEFDALAFELGEYTLSVESPSDDSFFVGFMLSTAAAPSNLDLNGIEAQLIITAEGFEQSLGTFNIGGADGYFNEGDESYIFEGDVNLPDGIAAGAYSVRLNIDPSNELVFVGGEQSFDLGSFEIERPDIDFALNAAQFDLPYFNEADEIVTDLTLSLSASDTSGFEGSVGVSVYLDTLQTGQSIDLGLAPPLEVNFGVTGTHWIDQMQGSAVFGDLRQTVLLDEFTFEVGDFGQDQVISVVLPDLEPGQYALRTVLDEGNLIGELNESNNSLEFPISLDQSLSDLIAQFGGENEGGEGGPGGEEGPGGEVEEGGEAENLVSRHSDFDNDGADDILLFNADTGSVGQFEFNGDGWSSIGRASAGWQAVDTGMLDGSDAYADVVLLNSETGEVGCFDMEGGANAGWQMIAQAGSGWEYINAADINGDGQDELVWFNADSGKVGLHMLSDTAAEWQHVVTLGTGWSLIGVDDLNYDGIDDLLVKNAETGVIGQFRLSADGSSEWRKIGILGEGWDVAGTGSFWDANYDEEEKDVLAFNETTGAIGCFDLYEGDVYWESFGAGGAGWQLEGISDLNGDGMDDILWRNDSGKFGEHMFDDGNATWTTDGFASANWDVVI